MAGTVTWAVITAADLAPFLVAPQLTALRTVALAQGQNDPFDDLLPICAGRVRDYIVSNPRNLLSATPNSVPPGTCVWCLCWLMIEALQARVPTLKLTEDQKKEISNAKNELEKIRRAVANNQLLIPQPDDPELDPAQSFGPQAYTVSSSPRLATRETLSGL